MTSLGTVPSLPIIQRTYVNLASPRGCGGAYIFNHTLPSHTQFKHMNRMFAESFISNRPTLT